MHPTPGLRLRISDSALGSCPWLGTLDPDLRLNRRGGNKPSGAGDQARWYTPVLPAASSILRRVVIDFGSIHPSPWNDPTLFQEQIPCRERRNASLGMTERNPDSCMTVPPRSPYRTRRRSDPRTPGRTRRAAGVDLPGPQHSSPLGRSGSYRHSRQGSF